MHKTHIVMLVDYYFPHRGGIEVCVEQHIHTALEAGYQVSVITSKHSEWLSTQEEIKTPMGSYTVYRTGSGRWSYYKSGKKFLKDFVTDHQIDLIHCHTYAAAALGAWAKKHFGITTVATIHEVFDRLWYRMKPWRSAGLYRRAEKWIVTRDYDYIHVPSEFTKQLLVEKYGIYEEKITKIYHDLDESRDPHAINSTLIHDRQMILGPDRYKILYYGHAGASKGVSTLIDALMGFLPDHPDTLFVANITASRGRDTLIHTIKKKLPQGSYHIETGMNRDRLQALVMSADLIIIPSLSEGFGFVGAEVSALGKQAIIAHSGALPEVVSGDIQFFTAGAVEELAHLISETYHHHTAVPPHPTSYQPQGNMARITTLYENILSNSYLANR